MNWHLMIASMIAVLGLSTMPLAPVTAPDIRWLGQTETGDVAVPTIVPVSVRTAGPVRKLNDSLGVDMTAQAALMVDPETGAVLYEKNADEVRTIASITKLMSLIVVLDAGVDLAERVEILKEDQVPYGTTTLTIGEKVAAKDLVAASLIGSDNTAIRALTRHVGGNREAIVELMNQKATRMGLVKTSFADVTGLSDANSSTAREIVTFARAAFAYPLLGDLAGRRTYAFTSEDGKEHMVRTTNRLIGSFVSVIHGKTGFVSESGYNLVAEVTDTEKRSIAGVVLGSATNDDRFHDFKMMAYWVWQNFTW